ncbi:MAG: methylenetetrahydrofolate reductase [Paracoccaceae bacterium]|tara:strand:+ start:269 stop:1156 length:888 start_codon:yes stop_codon:yes gene_type:complete
MSIRKLNKYSQSLDNKDFTISSEIFLRPDTDREAIKIQAELLKEHVDAILVTDNQSGQLHMSSLSAGIILKENGIDPIINLTCRNRNRISLTSELLGCASLDMKNLLLTRGEKIPNEVKRKAAALSEMNATELISLANKIKTDEKLPTNNDFLIGGVVTPFTAKPGWPAQNLTEKIDAGAQFMITHTCLDMEIIKIYMERLIATKLLRRMHLIAGIAILKSAEDAKWLREHRPNVMIPRQAVLRLESSDNPEKEGIKMCAEQLKALSVIPGISGAHIIASNSVLNIPEAVARSEL